MAGKRGNRPLQVLALGAVVTTAALGVPASAPMVLFGPDGWSDATAAGPSRGWAGAYWPGLAALGQSQQSAPGAVPAPAAPALPDGGVPAPPPPGDVPEALWPEGIDGQGYSGGGVPAPVSGANYALPAGGGPARAVPAGLSSNGIPDAALRAYTRAAAALATKRPGCRLDWSLLAAIGRVESDHGRYGGSALTGSGRSVPPVVGARLDGTGDTARVADTDAGVLDGDRQFDRAVGPMQFLPATWRALAVDADRDGASVQDIDDAALAAGFYLCAGGANLSTQQGRAGAVFRYNHSSAYVAQVLGLAARYAAGDTSARLPRHGAVPEVPDVEDSAVPRGPASPGPASRRPGARPPATGTTGSPPRSGSTGSTRPKPPATRQPTTPCLSEVEPNGSLTKATRFSSACGGRRYGRIATAADVDYSLLPVSGTGKDVVVTLVSPAGQDYDLSVIDAKGKATAAKPAGAGKPETVRLPTVKGTDARYRVKVAGARGSSSSSARYQVTTASVDPQPPTQSGCVSEVEPNDTAAKATRFSSACGGRRYGRIATAADVDYALLPVPGTGKDVVVTLVSPAGQDYDLSVTDVDGKTTAAKEAGAGKPESVRLPTVKGKDTTYRVRVSGAGGAYSASARYQVTTESVDPEPPAQPACVSEVEPNDSPAKATRFSAACGGRRYGRIETAGDVDYSLLPVSGTGKDVVVTLVSPAGQDYDLSVIDADGKTTAAKPAGAGKPETVRLPTVKGTDATYRVKVASAGGASSATARYEITAQSVDAASATGSSTGVKQEPVKPCVSEVEPNDSAAQATRFSAACGGRRYGRIKTAGDVDYSLLPVSGTGKDVVVTLVSPAGQDYDLSVIDAEGKATAAKPAGAGKPETVRLPTVKGKDTAYRVKVAGAGGAHSSSTRYQVTTALVDPE